MNKRSSIRWEKIFLTEKNRTAIKSEWREFITYTHFYQRIVVYIKIRSLSLLLLYLILSLFFLFFCWRMYIFQSVLNRKLNNNIFFHHHNDCDCERWTRVDETTFLERDRKKIISDTKHSKEKSKENESLQLWSQSISTPGTQQFPFATKTCI